MVARARLAATLAIIVAGGGMVQGCVVAAIPAGAALAMGSKAVFRDERDGGGSPAPVAARNLPPATGGAGPAPIPGSVPPGMQYLYGSGEAAALSAQAYNTLAVHLRAAADYRLSGDAVAAVALAPGSTLEQPRFIPCGNKPLAMVMDIDETALLNIGFEANDAKTGLPYDEARWRRWETSSADKVAAVPGAVEAVQAARRIGITVVFVSNRNAVNADATARIMAATGFGAVVPGQTLLLREEGAGGGKDARRAQVSAKYCIVALVGDQLGDFSDLFNADGLTPATRRAAANNYQFAPLWGAGWFLLPNPVYGTGLKGTLDEVFPPARQWTDPGVPAPGPQAQ